MQTEPNLIFGTEHSAIDCTRGRCGCRLGLQYGTHLGVIQQVFLGLLLQDTWACHAVTFSDKLYAKKKKAAMAMVCKSAKIFLMLAHFLLRSHRISVNETVVLKVIVSVLCLFYLYVQMTRNPENCDGI